ncbi:hypothetical protein JVT61DRAFT_10586 [Boletus reticuloceps]|uniref:Uncharacterized protein n=1 Tax=Boletus reticuloceps TaxID=495285 RepID=A0A8I2YFC2_9AGAM|nr:hypothetical protein JVT61DRAFT_10586 [Boletus reticuloceps]
MVYTDTVSRLRILCVPYLLNSLVQPKLYVDKVGNVFHSGGEGFRPLLVRRRSDCPRGDSDHMTVVADATQERNAIRMAPQSQTRNGRIILMAQRCTSGCKGRVEGVLVDSIGLIHRKYPVFESTAVLCRLALRCGIDWFGESIYGAQAVRRYSRSSTDDTAKEFMINKFLLRPPQQHRDPMMITHLQGVVCPNLESADAGVCEAEVQENATARDVHFTVKSNASTCHFAVPRNNDPLYSPRMPTTQVFIA